MHWHIQVSVTAQGKGSLAGFLLLAHIDCHDWQRQGDASKMDISYQCLSWEVFKPGWTGLERPGLVEGGRELDWMSFKLPSKSNHPTP